MNEDLHRREVLKMQNGRSFNCVCGYRFYFGKFVIFSNLIGIIKCCPECETAWKMAFSPPASFYALEQRDSVFCT